MGIFAELRMASGIVHCSCAPVLVAILRYVKEHIPGVQLVLIGSVAGDDPEG
jgi:hypothetical protein